MDNTRSANAARIVNMLTEMKRVKDSDMGKVIRIVREYMLEILEAAANKPKDIDWSAVSNYCVAVCKHPNQFAYPALANFMEDARKCEPFRVRAISEFLEVETDQAFNGNKSAALNHAALITGMSTGSFSRTDLKIMHTDFKEPKASGTSDIFAMFGSCGSSGGTQMTPYSAQKYPGVYDGPHMVPYSGQRGGDLVTREEIVDFRQALHSIGHRVQVQGKKLQAQGAQLESHSVTIDETAKKTEVNSESIKKLSASSQANADTLQRILDAKIQSQAAKTAREEAAEKARVAKEEAAEKAKAEKKAGKDRAEAQKDEDLDKRIARQTFLLIRAMEEDKAAASKKPNEAAGEEESDSDHEEQQDAAQAGAKRSHRAGGGAPAKAKAPTKKPKK